MGFKSISVLPNTSYNEINLIMIISLLEKNALRESSFLTQRVENSFTT